MRPAVTAARIRAGSNVNSSSAPATAGTTSIIVSTASNNGRLSSCRSLLYPDGRPFSVASTVVRSPSMRAADPRAISNTSGLRF